MPITVTYAGPGRGGPMEASARAFAVELETVYDHIARCDVRVDAPGDPHGSAQRFRVRVVIAVPGGEIIISPEPDATHDDAMTAVRDSFRAARRRLEQYVWRNLRDDAAAPRWPARPG
jgi:hypothetical protein